MASTDQAPRFQYVRLTASGLVKNSAGTLGGFMVASGTPTVKLWDNTSAAGAVLLDTLQTVAGEWYPLPASFTGGLYATLGGAGDITFLYQ